MKEPVDHIVRPSLPWRSTDEPTITECGYNAESVKTITREELDARTKEYGQIRTAMLTCMTCLQTSQRHADWEQDPRKALQREIEWECGWRKKRGERLRDELIAIQQLIELHPDEFKNLIERQQWRSKKPTSAHVARQQGQP